MRTTDVYVVFTSLEETLAALRVANDLAKAMGATVTLIHFRAGTAPPPSDRSGPVSPVATNAFAERLRRAGLDARVRVYVCPNATGAMRLTFRRRSLVVVGGRQRWWPTPAQRWRRALEAAGHFVVFVTGSRHREHSDA